MTKPKTKQILVLPFSRKRIKTAETQMQPDDALRRYG
jgi:hypothetical protein